LLIQSEFSQAKIRLIEHHRQQMLSEEQRFDFFIWLSKYYWCSIIEQNFIAGVQLFQLT